MRASKLAIVVAVAFAIVLGSGCNPDKNKLLFKPKQGEKRTVDTEAAINFSAKLMGLPLNFGTTSNSSFQMTTQSVDEAGIATIEVVLKSFSYDVTGLDGMLGGGMGGAGMPNMPGMPSGDDPFGMKATKAAIKSAEGQSFTVKVDRLGNVTEVSGANAIAEKAAGAFKAPSGAFKINTRDVFTQTLGDAAMKTAMQLVFTKRPDQKLNAGDTWQEQSTTDNPLMQVQKDATYTVKERNGGSVNTESVAKVDFKPQAALMKQAGNAPGLKVDISGQGTGSLSFDEATGWVTNGKSSGQIPGKISMQMPQAGNMEIPVEVSYTTSIRSTPS